MGIAYLTNISPQNGNLSCSHDIPTFRCVTQTWDETDLDMLFSNIA